MRRVLIVDDSPIIHRVLSAKLKAKGHEVLACAKDGNEGFELFSRHLPDLVLMDITMPNCDGREGLKLILQKYPQAKVIMLSALGEPHVIQECMSLGAQAFASKDHLAQEGYIEKIIEDAFSSAVAA